MGVPSGVEGTGAYGAGLTRYLRAEAVTVVEVDRPDRTARRARGKSDPLDAYAAARAAVSGAAAGVPKDRDDQVEAIRALRVARRSAVKARTQAMNQLRALLVTAPAELREQLRQLCPTVLIATCARLHPGTYLADPEQAVKTALRRLARRHQQLSAEIADADLGPLAAAAAQAAAGFPRASPGLAGRLGKRWSPPRRRLPRRRRPAAVPPRRHPRRSR